MSHRPVEAVFFWRYDMDSVFKPIYGRPPGGGYTKDYLQLSGDSQDALERCVRFLGEPIPIELRWPGGSREGNVRLASDQRGNLAWITPGGPQPWRLGNPTGEPEITFPGDRTRTTAAAADAELTTLQGRNLSPWVVAVKLWGQERVLHVRAYLGNPPAGQEARSTAELPQRVQEAMAALPRGTAGGHVTYGQVRAPGLTTRILETLRMDPNVLLVGPPGTGKTVAMEDVRSLFEGDSTTLSFDPDLLENPWSDEVDQLEGLETKTVSLVFHPAYSYEDFVAGLVPQTDAHGRLRLRARAGPLVSLSHWAADPGRSALMLLDEFNRGPAAAIFGDTLGLLDREKRHDPERHQQGATAQRPFPAQSMRVSANYANAHGRDVALELRLPASLWLLAALNSTDRSVAPLDAALRRRFSIIHVGPDYEVLAHHLGITVPDPAVPFAAAGTAPGTWEPDDVRQLSVRLLRCLNDRIAFILGDDFLLGHALFWSVGGSDVEALASSLVRAFSHRVAATLRLTFVDQDEALAPVLNIPVPTPEDGQPRVARWEEPPTELQAVAPARLQFEDVTTLGWEEGIQALVALL